jgi:hypothetical protein
VRWEVHDHEVLISFNGDDQALAFREWWQEIGATYFQEWLDHRKGAED